jgi:molecular chaperone DnaK (HSP70)
VRIRLGIDFGTTRTVVAGCDRGNYPIAGFVDGAGDSWEWFPSLVAVKDGTFRFGFDAARVAGDPGWTVIRSFKRLLAAPDAATRAVDLGGTRLGVLELTTRYLAALREALVTRSNLARGARGALEAVVAAPANARSTQRFLTIEAFRRAGFEVLAMLNEPSAAGFEYTHRYRATLTSRRDAIVVYDLGGGTFDVSLIRAHGRHHEVVATAGVSQLGGDDFDEALAELVLAAAGAGAASLDAGARTRLLDRCRLAKEALTPQSRRLVVDLEPVLGAAAGEVEVPVAAFYAAVAPLVEQTIVGMAPIVHTIEEEEGSAEAAAEMEQVAGIYVVGGASALPLVGRALRERFGRRVHRSPYSFAATALGLAIAADAEAGFTLRDQLSRCFGVFREAHAGAAVSFDPILGRDAAVPAPGQPPLTLRRVYRAVHNVGHYRFAECAAVAADGAPVGDLTPVGQVRFAFDPALRAHGDDLAGVAVERRDDGDGPMVQEEYTVDPSGIVSVTISDLDTGYTRRFQLDAPRAAT